MSARVDHIRERVKPRDELGRRGRYGSLAFLLGVGDQEYVVTIDRGRVTSVEPRRLATSTGRFTIRAATPAWEEFWKPVPRRDHHDLWSMLAAGIVKIDGDLRSEERRVGKECRSRW